jgi:hypothetical protein
MTTITVLATTQYRVVRLPIPDQSRCRSAICIIRHQTRLLTDAFTGHLDYRTQLQRIMKRPIDRITTRCACPSRQSASVKSP